MLQRSKIGQRSDTPSGNSVAALALDRLGHLVGEPRYSEAARRTVEAFKPFLEQKAVAHGILGIALEELLTPPAIVILTGGGESAAWQRALAARYLPRVLALALAPDTPNLPPALIKPTGGGLKAWVCQGVTCLPPITDAATLLSELSLHETA